MGDKKPINHFEDPPYVEAQNCFEKHGRPKTQKHLQVGMEW